ncbi:MAG: glycosyltransferase [Anaerolineae bacterium]|nr:glycosyltransferase [Anaerolineae bacterium]
MLFRNDAHRSEITFLKMAHILFIYKQFPALSVGHAGGESLFRLMAALHRRGHRISLVARIMDEEQLLWPEVEAICEYIYTTPHHRTLPGPRPLALLRSYLALRHLTKRVLREIQPDLVHVETTQTAIILMGVSLPPASFRTQDVNWFLQQQQVAHQHGIRRLIAQMRAWVFRAFEPLLYRRYDILLAISEGDRQLLQPVCVSPPLLLLPLAPLTTPSMTPAFSISEGYVDTNTTDTDTSPITLHHPNILFVGAMSRDHNLNGVTWFLDQVWPRILAQISDVHFYIVGGGPPDVLRARADNTITVTGFVDDLASWYRAADVFVSPLLVAGGLLQKVVDAMAMAVPVVATSVCNHGISAKPGEHLITADTPATFADAVVHLLQMPNIRQRLGVAGQQLIYKHYNTERAIDEWEAALLALLSEQNMKREA